MPQDMTSLWEEFSSTGDDSARAEIITNYVPLANKIADWMQSSLPAQVDRDDIRSSAYEGLIDAVNRFDPSKGFKFETFATPRIRGSVMDSLRGADWAPRSLRSKARELLNKTEELTGRLNREPTDHEIAEGLDWTVEEVRSVRSSHVRSQIHSMQENWDNPEVEHASETEDSSHSETDPSYSLDSEFDFDNLINNLSKAITALSPKERAVFTLFYYEDASLAEIGKLLNVTESRVCQILTQAALNCRSFLDLSHL